MQSHERAFPRLEADTDDARIREVGAARDVRNAKLDEATRLNEAEVREAVEELRPDTAGRDLQWKIGALPVVEGDRPIGILTKSDALEALLAWAEGPE